MTLLICVSGLTSVFMSIIPFEVVMVLLVYVGLISASQAFESDAADNTVALLIGLIPLIFNYIQSLLESAVLASGTSIDSLGPDAFQQQSLPIVGIGILANGAFLSSLLWTSIVLALRAKREKQAIFLLLISALCSGVGMVHVYPTNWQVPSHILFVAVYMVMGAYIFLTCDRIKTKKWGI